MRSGKPTQTSSGAKKAGIGATLSRTLGEIVKKVVGEKATPSYQLGNIRGKGVNFKMIGQNANPEWLNTKISDDE